MKYDPKEALQALLNGEWDNVHLLAFGDLYPTLEENIKALSKLITF